MKKLTLDIEQLDVKSFETEAVEGERGTVHAASDIESFGCSGWWFCLPYPSRGCE